MLIELIKLGLTLIRLQSKITFLIAGRLLLCLIPSPIIDFVNTLSQNINITEKKIWGTLRFLVTQLVFFWIALILGFLAYIMIYHLAIPHIDQLSKISFTKSHGIYNARIFNPEGNFPVCTNKKILTNDKELLSNEILKEYKISEEICINPIQRNIMDFQFERETYKISLKFVVPRIESNLRLGTFTVDSKFINKDYETLYSHGLGVIVDDTPYYSLKNVMSLAKKGIGIMGDEIIVDVLLAENFQNDLFGINVINIEVPHADLAFKYCYINIQAKIVTWRYLMYYWFWISWSIGSVLLTIFFFIIINLIYISINFIFRIINKVKKLYAISSTASTSLIKWMISFQLTPLFESKID